MDFCRSHGQRHLLGRFVYFTQWSVSVYCFLKARYLYLEFRTLILRDCYQAYIVLITQNITPTENNTSLWPCVVADQVGFCSGLRLIKILNPFGYYAPKFYGLIIRNCLSYWRDSGLKCLR